MSHKDLPRVTYFNTDLDMSGIHALFDAEFPKFRAMLQQMPEAWFIGEKNFRAETYDVVSPIDRDLKLGLMEETSAFAVEQQVNAARHARAEWEALGFAGRIKLLRQAADELRSQRFHIGLCLVLEVGKSRAEAMGEVEEAIDMIEAYCAQAEGNDGFSHKMKAVGEESGVDLLRPYGAFAIIAPFNFPLALSVSMISAALLMGNTVVFKPTQHAIFSAAALRDIFRHLPPGVFNMVTGSAAVGAALAGSAVDGIAFTGSRTVGMQLLRDVAGGDYMRPVVAELGGKNATFVCGSADVAIAAKAVVRAAFGLSGQKCSACSKVYVARSIADAFCARLVEEAQSLTIGDPQLAGTFMGPVINEAAATRFAEAVNTVDSQHILTGGARLTGGLYDRGHYLSPTILRGLPADHDINRRELFVPLLSVLEMDDLQSAIDDANQVPYGLTAGLYTKRADERDLFLSRHEAGVMYVNRPSASTTGAWPGYQGFCGWKGSGLSGKGGLGPHYLGQFGREQSRTVYP